MPGKREIRNFLSVSGTVNGCMAESIPMTKAGRKRALRMADLAEALAALPESIKKSPVGKIDFGFYSDTFEVCDQKINIYRWKDGAWVRLFDGPKATRKQRKQVRDEIKARRAAEIAGDND